MEISGRDMASLQEFHLSHNYQMEKLHFKESGRTFWKIYFIMWTLKSGLRASMWVNNLAFPLKV